MDRRARLSLYGRQSATVIARIAVASLLGITAPAFGQSTGSAFEVSDGGHLLTDRHVIVGCKTVHIKRGDLEDPVQVVASDATRDLALLFDASLMADRASHRKMTGGASLPYARFPDDKHHLLYGEGVVVAGYPLAPFLGGMNVTTGNVSALTGPNNDANLFQLTAPIQGGNSGGPVLDMHGTVVGVVVSTLDPVPLQKYGVIPQNVNFAIQGKVARDFVRQSTGNAAVAESAASPEWRMTSVASYATQLTFQVICPN
jgi:serine protease Do